VSKAVIRDICEEDIPALKALMVEAWGEGWNFNRFDPNADLFCALQDVYLSVFLNSATCGKIALQDGKVVGAVLCAANGEDIKFRAWQKDVTANTLTLLSAAENERKDIVEHISTAFGAIGQLLHNKTDAYGGSLEFLVVTPQARGLKIGKQLWDEACGYFRTKNKNSIYLITDTACNVGFYDYNGFLRVDSITATYNFSTGQKEFDIFLYEYNFDN